MKTSTYDITIVGSGPIGAATAYFLKDSGKNIALLGPDSTGLDKEHIDTYKYSGGCIRWDFENPEVTENTKITKDYILGLQNKGIDLSLIEDQYVFLYSGYTIPSLNVSGIKLVDHLLNEATASGSIEHSKNATMESYKKEGQDYVVETTQGQIRTKKLLLALGSKIVDFIPEAGFEYEKREVLVLNIPVDDKRAKFPHTIATIENGVVFLFIKETSRGKRMLLGQEDIIETNEQSMSGQDYLQALKDKRLLTIFPFLKDALTEEVLWGFDAKNKTVKIYSPDQQLFAATCGSAIRSCIAIGKTVSDRLLSND